MLARAETRPTEHMSRAQATLVRLEAVSVLARGMPILDGVTLAIRTGAPMVLVGPNGAGKSTLLRLCMGLLSPSAGRLERAADVRASFVFQRPVMLRRTAAANIAYACRAAGLPSETRTIESLLARVDLAHVAGRPARRLSGGEQQRLAIARALAREPTLIFLDEPTASLDPASTKGVEDIIGAIAAQGVKVVMATHDLGQAKRLAGDVVFLVKGCVREHAAGANFFAQPQTDAARQFLAGDLVL